MFGGMRRRARRHVAALRAILGWAVMCAAGVGATESARLDTVRAFADTALEQARARWSGRATPLLADGLDVATGAPVVWRHKGREFLIHNLASQQNFFRVLSGLSLLTGDPRYREAALAAFRYHFDHLTAPCGLLRWGGHQFIDLRTLKPVGDFDADCHEFKFNLPYYDLMFEANPEATVRFWNALWNSHVLDWSRLDMNRHGPYGRKQGKLWDHDFDDPDPFFEGQGLTFISVGTDLIYAGILQSLLSGEDRALVWAERLARQYVRARHPRTGLGAYQYSKPQRRSKPPSILTEDRHTGSRYGDRAENQFGAEFGEVAREGWVLWDYKVPALYARNALVQLALAERLGEAKGRRLLDWTLSGMRAFVEQAYQPQENRFRPMWADGTDMSGYVIRSFGYYNDSSKPRRIEPVNAGPDFLVAYARAWRLSRDATLWTALRGMYSGNRLGELGATPDDAAAPNLKAGHANVDTVFAILELYRATSQPSLLDQARLMADHLIRERFRNGWFLPSERHAHAAIDAREPLAILAVEAAARGRLDEMPDYVAGRGYIHGRFDGLGRVYDHRAIWSRERAAP